MARTCVGSNSASVFVALALLTLFCLIQPSLSKKEKTETNKLLLILVDGVHWNYVNKYSDELPAFRKLKEKGAAAEAFIPVFPSLSLVNYYSIMTGNLYRSYIRCNPYTAASAY